VLSAAHPARDFEWTAKSVRGAYDFQQDVYRMVADVAGVDDAPIETRQERAPHDDYLDRELDRTVAAVTEAYDAFRFHDAVGELRELARLLGRYRGYDRPHDRTYRRGLSVLSRMLAPFVPFLGEELWSLLDGDGLMAVADWPTPRGDVDDYGAERRLVRTTLEDVREITDVVGITDPERIELVVAAPWKYRAHALARETGEDEAVVGRVLEGFEDEDEDEDGDGDGTAVDTDRVAEYAAGLAAESLAPALSADRERTVLAEAVWLLDDEFGAEVVVRAAAGADDDLAAKAEPGKPAIRID